MEELKKLPIDLIAGAVFALCALISIVSMIIRFNAQSLIAFLAYGVLAAILFMRRKDITAAIGLTAGFALLAVMSLIGIIHSLSSFINFIAYAATAIIAVTMMTDYIPQLKDIVKKFWFAPAALLAVSAILGFFVSIIVYIVHGVLLIHGAPLRIFFSLILSLIMSIIGIAGVLLATVHIVFPEGIPDFKFMNKSGGAATSATTAAAPVQAQKKAPDTTIGAADELKKYKDLLDSGAITQEEYDAKKKQLLDL